MVDLDRRMFIRQNEARIDRDALRLDLQIKNDLRRPFPFELIFATRTEIDRTGMIIKFRGRRDEVSDAAIALESEQRNQVGRV